VTDRKHILTKRDLSLEMEVNERTIDRWRSRRTNPLPFIAINARNIRFLRSEVDQWLDSQRGLK
jgi:predicted DNA-binding transcriptional regulator AlpA